MRNQCVRFITRVLKEESGQAMTEYILILSLAAVAASALTRMIVKTLDKGVLFLGGQLERDLKTGRAPLNVWQN